MIKNGKDGLEVHAEGQARALQVFSDPNAPRRLEGSLFQLTNPENPDLCDPALSQWYTPPELAERIVEWALGNWACSRPARVLEPSCGHGALVHPLIKRHHEVVGVDTDQANVDFCREFFPGAFIHGDFVKLTKIGLPIDIAVMNPPFEDGQSEAHILHALTFAPRVVAHVPLTTLAGKERRAGLWSQCSLTRMVVHSTRPKYSGNLKGGMTDMMTIEVVPELQDGVRTHIEWWA